MVHKDIGGSARLVVKIVYIFVDIAIITYIKRYNYECDSTILLKFITIHQEPIKDDNEYTQHIE